MSALFNALILGALILLTAARQSVTLADEDWTWTGMWTDRIPRVLCSGSTFKQSTLVLAVSVIAQIPWYFMFHVLHRNNISTDNKSNRCVCTSH